MYKDKIDFFLNEISKKCNEDKAENITFSLGSSYYSLFYHEDVEIERVETLIDLASEAPYYSFASGSLAVTYFMRLLHTADIITDEDIDAIEEDSIEFFLELLATCVNKKEYDLFTGLIGLGLYFIEIQRFDTVAKIVSYIDHLKHEQNNSFFWIDHIVKEDNICDLGLAHGLPSIISFLAECYHKNCEKETCEKLIRGTVNFLINLYEENKNAAHIFPSKINVVTGEKQLSNRLAWCYGDLGVALSLWKAYTVLQDENLKDICLYMTLNSAKIRLDKSGVFSSTTHDCIDTGICHGTSGISHIFNKFFKIFQREELKEAHDYWMSITLQQLEKGIKFPYDPKNDVWVEHTGLLEGISGVGMVLLDYQYPDKAKDWDKIYLMNIG
ncbi:lanthionine synthetase LanC family protein [Chryseobacterium tructae]|uniref:Lanthionine synthetase LanC family protein n=1 Tax=Chryseobacterium tructae TaxID=1037380 RepID=A0ABV7XUD0_9FLAO|nr:lanthionine synthetase LanC family protein [Chryseobacterium tructae]MDN3691631.1 lanthionine synthetase LanC family protein [Chryseobacterium tructae]